MSPEINQESKTLCDIVIMLLLVLAAILIIGIFTRPDQLPINAHTNMQDLVLDMQESISDHLSELQEINSQLKDIQYIYAKQHKNSVSSYIKSVNSILRQMKSGEIVLGGE